MGHPSTLRSGVGPAVTPRCPRAAGPGKPLTALAVLWVVGEGSAPQDCHKGRRPAPDPRPGTRPTLVNTTEHKTVGARRMDGAGVFQEA